MHKYLFVALHADYPWLCPIIEGNAICFFICKKTFNRFNSLILFIIHMYLPRIFTIMLKWQKRQTIVWHRHIWQQLPQSIMSLRLIVLQLWFALHFILKRYDPISEGIIVYIAKDNGLRTCPFRKIKCFVSMNILRCVFF